VILGAPVNDELSAALLRYASAFGHSVPNEIIEMFSNRSWLLMNEIRQAVELHRPVPAWLARSKNGAPGALPTSLAR
jgi:hypothetical protein